MVFLLCCENILKRKRDYKNLAIIMGEHLCTVNILLGPRTVHYREVLLYPFCLIGPTQKVIPYFK